MIRLILLSLFPLISLLAVFRAPTYRLWQLSIAVMEFPWVFVILTILLLCFGTSQYMRAGTIIGIAALVLFISPVVRAYLVAAELNKNIEGSLGAGSSQPQQAAFSFWKMIRGTRNKRTAYQSFVYSKTDSYSLSLDYYPSQISGKKPCVIVVHGGSWSAGDSKQLPELNSYLSQKGYNVASINYRLAPQYLNPLPVQDVKAVIQYLKQHANELNIDTNNFVLLGRSAGAQIALLAAYTLHETGLKGVIDFYGPADMVWGYSVPSNPLIMDSRKVMEDYLGGTYSKVPENYAASSPIEFVTKQSVPTLIIHGKQDVLVSYLHSVKLNKKLGENGIKHFFLSLPWATHGFDYTLNGPAGQLSTYTIERFLKQVTK